jgi:hypothetical protein
MRYCIPVVWLVPFLGAAALGADDLPQPKKDTTAPPAAFPDVPAVRAPTAPPSAASPELQRLLRDLRSQREALRDERTAAEHETAAPGPVTANEAEIARLRKRMEELSARSGGCSRGGSASLPPESSPLTMPTPVEGPGGVLDPIGVANNYFKAGDFQAALEAYRKVPLRGAADDERAPVMYMIATCLRKIGKREEAATMYREVTALKGDPFVTDFARWQLESMAWRKDMEAQLAQLAQRRKGIGPGR